MQTTVIWLSLFVLFLVIEIITIHSYVIAFAEFSVIHFLSPFKLLLLDKYCLTEILYSCFLLITIPIILFLSCDMLSPLKSYRF